MTDHKIKGFSKVLVSNDITEGINHLIQTVGLGGLRHNAVIVGWPHSLSSSEHHEKEHWKIFLDAVRVVRSKGLALLVPRNIEKFPHNKDRLTGTIDIWWIIHDGGMLLLLAFLLHQHKVWKQCRLRLFTVAQLRDNSIQMKKDLEQYLYQLRIDAEVHVEEMHESDVSAFTVELTLDMERRNRLLRELKIARGETVDDVLISSHTSHSLESFHDIHADTHSAGPEIIVTSPTSDVFEIEGNHVEVEQQKKVKFQIQEYTDGEKTDHNGGDCENDENKVPVHFTFTPLQGKKLLDSNHSTDDSSTLDQKVRRGSAKGRLLRMHTAVKLNEVIRDHSSSSSLVIVNFPAPPSHLSASENYVEYLEVLTNGIDRVLMVRGSGREVITMFS